MMGLIFCRHGKLNLDKSETAAERVHATYSIKFFHLNDCFSGIDNSVNVLKLL